MKKQKTLQKVWLPLMLMLGLSYSICILFRVNLFTAILLFWGMPAVYFSCLNKKLIVRVLLFSFFGAGAFGLIIDYLGHLNHVWYTPHTIFHFRLFGLIPVENPFDVFLYIYTVVMAYEALIKPQQMRPIKKQFYILIGVTAFVFAAFYWAATSLPGPFSSIPYMYLNVGFIAFLLPLVVFLLKFPTYRSSVVRIMAYFFLVSLFHEVVALKLNHWYFPSTTTFIGKLNVLGVSIPFEELLFFILIGPGVILAYYIFFFKGPSNRAHLANR